MRALILGGNGFLGSHLADLLLAKGQSVRVYGHSRNNQTKQQNGIEYIEGDFGEKSKIKSSLQNIDIVYHLISTTNPSSSNRNPVHDSLTNVTNTIQLLEECVNASVRKIIFPSSGGAIYGVPFQSPMSEAHPTEPISSYAISKLSIEKYLHLFNCQYGLDHAILRIANPYGPLQDPAKNLGAITVFLSRILKRLPVQIWGDGEIVRDFVYVSDVIQAFFLAQKPNLEAKIFNIGSGRGLSLNQLIVEIRKIVQVEVQVEYLAGRGADVPRSVLCINRAKTFLEWAPCIELDDGIARTWDWLQSL